MNYGWTLDYALGLSARKLFAMHRAAREIYDDRMNVFYSELVDIVPAATGVNDYHKGMKEVYIKRLTKDTPVKFHGSNVYDLANKEQGEAALNKILFGMRGN